MPLVRIEMWCVMCRCGWLLGQIEGIISVVAKYLLKLNSQLGSASGTDAIYLAGL